MVEPEISRLVAQISTCIRAREIALFTFCERLLKQGDDNGTGFAHIASKLFATNTAIVGSKRERGQRYLARHERSHGTVFGFAGDKELVKDR